MLVSVRVRCLLGEAVDEFLTPETIEILGRKCLQLSLVQDAKALSVDGLMADARGNALNPCTRLTERNSRAGQGT